MTMSDMPAPEFVVCVSNDGYPASLQVRKLYEVVRDDDARSHQHLRVVDESGEDYLFPARLFMTLPLSAEIRRALTTG